VKSPGVTLAATTLASSMILVDQTAVPLAALMVLGGRLGDLLGLRRVFLVGALIFTAATGAREPPRTCRC
jgi:MFS family permease